MYVSALFLYVLLLLCFMYMLVSIAVGMLVGMLVCKFVCIASALFYVYACRVGM